MKIKIAAAQIRTNHSVTASVKKICAWIERAAAAGAQVVTFPEVAICGYPPKRTMLQRIGARAIVAGERKITAHARAHGISVVLGSVHFSGRKIFNDLLAIDERGTIKARQSKFHAAEEWSTAGSQIVLADVAGVRSGFVICFDGRFPEIFRLMAMAGAQVVYWSSKHSSILHEHKMSAYAGMPVARAAENSIFIVATTPPADVHNIEASWSGHGRCKIVDPDGNVLCEGGVFTEELVIAEIDTEQATRSVALRAGNDKTIFRKWLLNGVKSFVRLSD